MNKQKYKFSLTRAKAVKIEYNKGLNVAGKYYDTYAYNSSERIGLSLVGENYFNLADEFLNKIIKVAYFVNGVLDFIDDNFFVNENSRQFPLSANLSYIFSWRTDAFEPQSNAFIYLETQYVHPSFSKVSIDKARASYKMNWSATLSSDITFKNGAFDYLKDIDYNESIIFKIERFSETTLSYYTIYNSLPFSKANCTFDYDRRILTVDFKSLDYNSYLDKVLNNNVNIIKGGYKHEELSYNIPAMMQIYVDGTETVTNIVGGSATDIEISMPETPDDYLSNYSGSLLNEKWWPDYRRVRYLYEAFRFRFIGRIGEIRIVGSEPNGPAGYYYATTSDNQVSQSYTPTSGITRYDNTDNDYYIEINATIRRLYIRLKSDDSIVYASTQTLDTNCLLCPDSIAGTILQQINGQEVCAVETHLVHSVFARILTAKEDTSALGSFNIPADDFAYDARAYKYVVNIPLSTTTEVFKTKYNGSIVDNHLIRPIPYEYTFLCLACSSRLQSTDSGLGSANQYEYYTYSGLTGSFIKQHAVPIGNYFWSGVSFYACLSSNFINILEPWYLRNTRSCFFTIGTAIRKILQKLAPNVRFVESNKYSSFLYPDQTLQPIGSIAAIAEPSIYLTHLSNLQAGLFEIEAQKLELNLNDIFNLLQNAFQVYYFIDDEGYLHLEHISWFYGFNKVDNVQFNIIENKDEYTKVSLDYGQGTISADDGYLYSDFSMTSDTDDSSELFNKLEIKCLESTCALADKRDVTLGKFRTDINYIYAEASDMGDGVVMLMPNITKIGKKPELNYATITRCDIKGLNDYPYKLWPINYRASSYSLLMYYRLNFASLLVDHCSFEPEERERFMKQELQIPIKFDIDMTKMIRTRFGEGLILSHKLDLDSRYASITLLHKG